MTNALCTKHPLGPAHTLKKMRRKLSINAAKQTSRLLLDRLQLLGEGAAEAVARRDRAVMAEAVAARERRAQEVCRRQGGGIVRRGFGLLRAPCAITGAPVTAHSL